MTQDINDALSRGNKIKISVHNIYTIQSTYHRSLIAAKRRFKSLKVRGYCPIATLVDKAKNEYASIDFDNSIAH